MICYAGLGCSGLLILLRCHWAGNGVNEHTNNEQPGEWGMNTWRMRTIVRFIDTAYFGYHPDVCWYRWQFDVWPQPDPAAEETGADTKSIANACMWINVYYTCCTHAYIFWLSCAVKSVCLHVYISVNLPFAHLCEYTVIELYMCVSVVRGHYDISIRLSDRRC